MKTATWWSSLVFIAITTSMAFAQSTPAPKTVSDKNIPIFRRGKGTITNPTSKQVVGEYIVLNKNWGNEAQGIFYNDKYVQDRSAPNIFTLKHTRIFRNPKGQWRFEFLDTNNHVTNVAIEHIELEGGQLKSVRVDFATAQETRQVFTLKVSPSSHVVHVEIYNRYNELFVTLDEQSSQVSETDLKATLVGKKIVELK